MESTSLLAQKVENILDFMQDKRIVLLTYTLDGGGPGVHHIDVGFISTT